MKNFVAGVVVCGLCGLPVLEKAHMHSPLFSNQTPPAEVAAVPPPMLFDNHSEFSTRYVQAPTVARVTSSSVPFSSFSATPPHSRAVESQSWVWSMPLTLMLPPKA